MSAGPPTEPPQRAHRTLRGGTTYAPGAFGQGFVDGAGDYISFGTSAGYFGTADFSVSFWLRSTQTGDRTEGVIGKRPACQHG